MDGSVQARADGPCPMMTWIFEQKKQKGIGRLVEITVGIDLSSVRPLLDKLTPEQLGNRARAAMGESLGYLQAEIQKELPRGGTGILKGTLFTETRGTRLDDLRGIVASPQKYAVVVEKGRRPGAKMPPVAAIELWARRVLGVTGLGFVIARSIAKKGIKPRPIFETVAKRGQSVVQRIFLKHFGRL